MAQYADLRADGTQRYSSAALENVAAVTQAQAVFLGADGRNTDSSNAIFVQVFDSATAPTSASVPVAVIAVPPAGTGASASNGNWSYQTSVYGQQFKNGIYIAASSTDAPTYTAISTNKTFFHVEWAPETGL